MAYFSMAIGAMVIATLAATIGSAPITAAGAFIAAGLFAIADSIESKNSVKRSI
jgi:uncharacterized membrane protein YhhN